MHDRFLKFYNDELEFIRHMGSEFAQNYPKIASRLTLDSNEVQDPHVERLIQAFAFLNARTNLKIEDDFPELNSSLLNTIYPHYQRSIPSLSIIKFKPKAKLNDVYKISKGTKLKYISKDDTKCVFTTCYPVELWPIHISHAELTQAATHAPKINQFSGFKSSLGICVETFDQQNFLSNFNLEKLRFFITDQNPYRFDLYDLIINHVIGIAIAECAQDTEPTILPLSCLKAVGYQENEGLLPYTSRSHLGYRLLTEYFVFPDKFLFFDLEGFSKGILSKYKKKFQIYFYFNKINPLIENKRLDECFELGCTPIINLFSKKAEPIYLTHQSSEIKITPDVRHKDTLEIYSVENVETISNLNEKKSWNPFFGLTHSQNSSKENLYWHSSQKLRRIGQKNLDTFLTLVNQNFDPFNVDESILQVDLLCSNGDIPNQLTFNQYEFLIQSEDGDDLLFQTQCLIPFTKNIRPLLEPGARWRLISHLSLNYLSLTNDQDGLRAFQEILTLYNFQNSDISSRLIQSIKQISTRKITARTATNSPFALCQGIEITLTVSQEEFKDTSLMLFTSVLESFFALYCNVNSFTQLIVKTTDNEVLKKWNPRSGQINLI